MIIRDRISDTYSLFTYMKTLKEVHCGCRHTTTHVLLVPQDHHRIRLEVWLGLASMQTESKAMNLGSGAGKHGVEGFPKAV